MKTSDDETLSRRKALAQLSALALGIYAAPAFTTLSSAQASSGSSGGEGGEGSSGSSGASAPSAASDPSEASEPSESEEELCSGPSGEGCGGEEDDEPAG